MSSVGAGSAGSVLAARLTEDDPDIHVLLLEAGPEEVDNPHIAVPGAVMLLHTTDALVGDLTVPQTHACLGMVNNVSPYNITMTSFEIKCTLLIPVLGNIIPFGQIILFLLSKEAFEISKTY